MPAPRFYVPNPLFSSLLHASEEFREGIGEIAEGVKDAAQEVAPERTGSYRDSIEVEQSGSETAVVTKDFAGHLVEFGSINNPAYAPLRNGARKAGLRLEEN